MATYKNTTQGLVDAYIGFFNDQIKMRAYYDQKAKEFGFTAAEVLAKRFERTYLNGFTSPASPAKHFWKNVSPGTELGEKLLATGVVNIEEGNSWGDTFWGVCEGHGENHLGKLIMEQRDALRRQQQ